MGKKKLLLVLAALVLSACIGINAQQTVICLSEDFQASSQAFPTGWDASDYANTDESDFYMWHPDNSGYNATGVSASTDYCALLYVTNGTSQHAALKTPAFTLPSDRDCVLSFRAKCRPSRSNLSIYVSTDGGTTYRNAPVVSPVALNDRWELYEFLLSDYRGQNVKVVFCAEPTEGASYTHYYLDNVSVTSAPLCQRAVGTYISDMTTSGATVNWGLRGTGYGDVPDSFNLRLLQGGTVVDSIHTAMPAASMYNYRFSNLAPGTTYTVRVESNCLAEYRGVAEYSEVTFVTPVTAQPMPYNENFDTLTAIPASFYTKGASFNAYAGNSYGGAGNSIRLEGDPTDLAYVVFPPIAERGDNFEMEFRLRRTSYDMTYFMAGYLTDPADISSFVPVLSDSVMSKDEWEGRRFNTSIVTDTTTPVFPMIALQNSGSTSLYIDNVSVHAIPTCTRPENLICTTFDANNATISWGTTNAPNIRLMMYDESDTVLLRSVELPTTAAPYTVTGLTPQTTYNFHLRGLCSATDSSDLTEALTVRTACLPVTEFPVVENFENETEINECWKRTSTGRLLPTVSSGGSDYTHSGTQFACFYDQNSISTLYTPAMIFDGTKIYSVNFWMYRMSWTLWAGSGEKLEVYLAQDPLNTATYTLISSLPHACVYDPVEPEPGLYEYYYEIPAGTSGQQYVVFKYFGQGGGSLYLDDITIAENLPCTPVRARFVEATQSSFTLKLDSVVTDLLVAYGPQGTPREQCTTAMFTDSVVTVSGLASGTVYDYYLSRVCGNDTAVWTDVASFNTETGPAQAPYFCGFENDVENGAWITNHTTGNIFTFGTNSRAVRSGSRALYVSDDGSDYYYNRYAGAGNITAARLFHFDAKKYILSFDWSCTGGEGGYDYGRAFLSPTTFDHTTVNNATPFSQSSGNVDLGVGSGRYDDVRLSGTPDWIHVEQVVDMTDRPGDYNLVFFWRQDGSGGDLYPISFDNVEMIEARCMAPAVAVRNLTNDAAQFVYTSDDTAQYEVIVDTVAFEKDALPQSPFYRAVESGNTTSLTGLTSNTVYYYTARSICAPGDTGQWARVMSFRTACDTLAFPLTEDFEGTVFPPDCWVTGSTTRDLPDVQSVSGTRAVRFRNLADGQANWIAAPQMNYVSGRNYAVSFRYVRSTTGSGDLTNEGVYLYAGSNANDVSDATFIGFVPREPAAAPMETAAGAYTYRFPLPASVSGRKYIIFRYSNQGGAESYIDDINIEQIQGCGEVLGLTRNVTENSATIELSDTSITHWQVAYGTDATATENLTTAEVNGASSYTLPGIQELTTYKYMVRRICGAGDTSAWSAFGRFTTPRTPTPLPYYSGFEDATDSAGWTIVKTAGENELIIGSDADAVQNGQKALYVSNAGSYTYNNRSTTNAYAYRLFRFTPEEYQIEFAWQCDGGEGGYDFGRVMLIPANVDPTSFENRTVLSSAIQLGGDKANYGRMNLSTGWNNVTEIINFAGREGLYNLVIYWRNDGSDGVTYKPLSIDDVSVSRVTCHMPNVSITGLSASAATVSYTGAANGGFEVVVDNKAINTRNIASDAILHTFDGTGSVQVTGLTPNTDYYYAVRAICGPGDTSAWTTPTTFTTYCLPQAVPYHETFEVESNVNCWTSLSPNGTGRYSTTKRINPGSMKLENTNMASPEFDVDSLDTYMLNGWAYATTDNATISVGVMADLTDASSYEPIANITFPKSYEWREFSVYFNVLGGSDYSDPSMAAIRYAKHIVLAAGQYTVYFDDLDLGPEPTCPKPTGATLSGVTDHSFDISFTESGTATQWVVDVEGQHTVVTTNPATITGLRPQTDYAVQVASICGEGDTSFYAYAGIARTPCAAERLPYVQSFENWDDEYTTLNNSNVLNNWCWDQIGTNGNGDGYPRYGGENANATDGSKSLLMTASSNTDMYLIMPLFPVTNNLNVQFDAKWESRSYSGMVSVGYITDPADSRTYVNVYDCQRTTTMTHFSVNMPNMPVGARIVLLYRQQDRLYDCWLDNLIVDEIRNCSATTAPVFSNVTATTAHVAFTDGESTHTAWQYVVCAPGLSPDNFTAVDITTDTFTLTGLTDATDYEVSVRAVCGAGDTSTWRTSAFRTECYPFVVTKTNAFNEGFEGGEFPPTCWSQTCYGYDFNSWRIETGEHHTGSASAHASDAQSGNHTVLITPALTLNSTQGYTLRYWQRRTSTNYQYAAEGFHVYLSTTPEIDATTAVSKMELGFVATHYLCAPVEEHDGWFEYTFQIPATEQGVRYIIFDYANQYGSGAQIDDVTVEENVTCVASRVSPVVLSTTMTSIDAVATERDEREIQFGAAAGAQADPASITAVTSVATDGTVTLTGLTGSTTYSVFYRYICEPGDTSVWSPAAVCTTQESNCFEPQNVRLDGTETYCHAGLVWGAAPDAVEYEYALSQGMSFVAMGTVTSAACSFDSLTAQTAYTFAVRTYCATDTTEWVTFNFTTPETPESLPFICDFDSTGTGATWVYTTFNGLNAFTIGSGARTGNNALYVSKDASTFQYDENSVSASMASVALEMGVGSYSISYDWISNGEFHSDYGHIYLVPSTTALDEDVVKYAPQGAINVGGFAELSEQGSWTTNHTLFNVTTAGVYRLVFTWTNNTWFARQPPFAVDNIDVHEVNCPQPGNVSIDYVRDTTATIRVIHSFPETPLEWGITTGADESSVAEWHLDTTGTAIALYTIDSLSMNTAYTFYVRSSCDSGLVSMSRSISFSTLERVVNAPFGTDFEADNSAWNFTGTTGNRFVIGSGTNNGGSNALYVTDDGSTYNYGDHGSTATYAYINVEMEPGNYTLRYDWLCNGEWNNDFGRFFAMPYTVAVPSGFSWAPSATGLPQGGTSLDNNEALGYQTDWQNKSVHLNIAERKIMRFVVAWVNDGGRVNNPPLAIDNVNFAIDVAGGDVYDTICYNRAYSAHGVTIAQGAMQPGDSLFQSVFSYSTVVGEPDTLYNVHVHMRENIVNTVYDTICAGQPYNRGEFNIANPRTTTYPIWLTSRDGCDSTVTLNLYVVPQAETRYDTICPGDVYTLGTQTITEAGVYTEVITGPRGCPDSVTVYLAVVDTFETVAETICEGDSLVFEGQAYTQSGVYRVTTAGPRGCQVAKELTLTVLPVDITIDTTICSGSSIFMIDTVITTAGAYTRQMPNVLNCMVTYHINVTVADPIEAHIADVACEGRPYSGYGVNNVAITADTLFVISSKTNEMCDSITYLTVEYHATARTDTAVTIQPGETFTWNDNTYSVSGTYVDTVQDSYGCDSILTLTLTVPDGVDNVTDNGRIRVVPNPTVKGQAALVFTEATGRIVRVEVINSFGGIVDSWQPTSTPIDMRAPEASGIYHVRVITAEGRVYVEKLIVQ